MKSTQKKSYELNKTKRYDFFPSICQKIQFLTPFLCVHQKMIKIKVVDQIADNIFMSKILTFTLKFIVIYVILCKKS